MTPEAQRIAIAEACGWKPLSSKDPDIAWVSPELLLLLLPDYLNDLNAMHEAEKTLDRNHRVLMTNFLGVCIVRELKPTIREMTKQIHLHIWSATASQRAEAFLKTIGKWVDD